MIIGVSITAMLGELAVRQIYDVPWEIDEEFGCIVRPGTTATYRLEGNGISRWTAHGIRAAAPIDPARHPILVLGDSFTEAYQVNDDETFTRGLEARLRAASIDVDVANAGRSAASPADYAAYSDRNLKYFTPRWVVVQLNEDDLIGDAWDGEKAHFAITDGRLVAEPAPPRRQSAIARVVWRARQHIALLNYGIIRLQQFAAASGQASPLFSAASQRPGRKPGRTFTDAEIAEQLKAVTAAYRGRVTFLLLPPFDPEAPARRTAVEKAYLSACSANGWSCVSLRDGYESFARDHVSPFGFPNSGFNIGHMNTSGHRLAADLLAAELGHLHTDALF